ncbi:MAG TPA: penicillin-binding protein [Ignavibacteriaceae bacterium]|nr:penicillin-binding protein [Ignavibacteriaceae bacterium]
MNNRRVLLIVLFAFISFIILVIKLIDVQIVKSEELRYYAERQQTSVEKIRAERGLIYDRNNSLLVYNRDDVSFYVDLRMTKPADKTRIAEKFSSIFGNTKAYYLKLMNSGKGNVCLEKKASGEKAILLKNFRMQSIFTRDDPTRIYYYKNLASHLLGYVNSNYEGINGIAGTYNDVLSGEDGAMLVERDAIGDMITVEEEQTKPAVPGLNIILTIDKAYQSILEEELANGVKQYEASSGVGIIMDPNTGEILALANNADYDPNEYWDYSDDQRRDRAITDTYEPGSTFKSFTMAALIDRNLCNESENIFVENGRYKVKSTYISDTHENAYLTVKGILEQSSNIGISKLVQRIDNEEYYKYLRGFGFGNYTSIPLPGEAKGTLKKPDQWGSLTKTFMSFGYEIAVTPLQLITAYCAIVNGGILYEPKIVLREVSRDGKIIVNNSHTNVRRVISESTSSRLRKMLLGVVENGTGKNARIEGVSIGGKTGTSQRLIDGNYSKEQYNSSFIGFFPADHPGIVCLILLNSPKVGRYGGLAAAPVFKNVALRIIERDKDLLKPPSEESIDDGLKIVNTRNTNNNNISYSNVSNRMPDESMISDCIQKKVMPDLSNYYIKDAISILSKLGIKYRIKGTGLVLSQSITPGTGIKKGQVCALTCREISVSGTAVY